MENPTVNGQNTTTKGKSEFAERDQLEQKTQETPTASKPEEKTAEKKPESGEPISEDGKGKDKDKPDNTRKGGEFSHIAAEVSPGIAQLDEEISALEELKSKILKDMEKVDRLLKPIKRSEKALQGNRKELSSAKRKVEKLKRKDLKKKLLAVNNLLKIKNEKLKNLSENEAERLDVQYLRDQSNSIAYIKKNKASILQDVLNILNSIIRGEDFIKRAAFMNLRTLSFLNGEEGAARFNQAFAELLKNDNERTYILTSGILRSRLYGAVKLTLQMWNNQEQFIGRLVFPEDLQEDSKQAPDPFVSNRVLLTSLIQRFLNKALREGRGEVVSLRDKAKDVNGQEAFTKAINEFVKKDVEVEMIGAGGLRDRLNETLRLTLLNWQPELPGGFEEVIFQASLPLTVKFEAETKEDALAISRELKNSHRLWKVGREEEKDGKWIVIGQNVSLEQNDKKLSKQMRMLALEFNCSIVN